MALGKLNGGMLFSASLLGETLALSQAQYIKSHVKHCRKMGGYTMHVCGEACNIKQYSAPTRATQVRVLVAELLLPCIANAFGHE